MLCVKKDSSDLTGPWIEPGSTNRVVKAGLYTNTQINEDFLTLEGDLGLNQIIDTSTREDNIHDLFFTNRPSLVNRDAVILGISEHHAIYFD